MKLQKAEKLVANLHDKTECYTHNKFKASIKSWINFESDYIYSKSLAKTIY